MSGKVSAPSSKFPHPSRPHLADEGPGSPARPQVAQRGEKARRLLKHADFQRVYQNGHRQFTGNMTVFFLRRQIEAPPNGGPRVGLTVGKVLGGAVERNRIKRRMREAVRLSLAGCAGPVDIVFHPRKSVLGMPFPELLSEVTRGLRLAVQRARVAESVK